MFWPHNWRCVTQRQPLASLVAVGAKQIITHAIRPDRDDFPLAIVASSNGRWYPEWDRKYMRGILAGYAIKTTADTPTACVVATAWMASAVAVHLCTTISRLERNCGQYTTGMWAWFLVDIFALDEPIACSPEAGLWTPGADLARRLHAHHHAKLRGRLRA